MGLPARKYDRTYTYGDYKTWSDDERWELIDGVAWNMSPAPSRTHQAISAELVRQLGNYLLGNPCEMYAAPFDVFFPESSTQAEDDVTTVVQPDITVVCDQAKLVEKGCFGAPDLVVEILSPYTSKKDLKEKFDLYERSAVREYWVVDPGGAYVHIYRLDENGTYGEPDILVHEGLATSNVLPGFSFDIAEIFKE